MATFPVCNDRDTMLTAEICEDLDNSRQEEIDLLEAIYITELTLGRDESGHVNTVTLLLHPATGENAQLQYVCLTLEFLLPSEYPAVCPEMSIRNPRGLSDEHLTELRDGLHKLAEERKGNPMLYELIEYVKESLTQSNVPHGSCIICLEPFDDGQAFTRTACYHYFHSTCLVRYIQHSQSEMEDRKKEAQQHQHLSQGVAKDVVCPICRVKVSYDADLLKTTPDSESLTNLPPLSEDIRQMQAKMAKLFQKQKAKGGIIDLEAEKNKYLVTRDTVLIIPVEPTASSSCQSDASPDDPTEDVPGKKNNRKKQKKPFKSSQEDRRSKAPEKSVNEERPSMAAMSKEEADLNKRRLMNQRRRNNQQQFRSQPRNVAKEEESHTDSANNGTSDPPVAEEEIHSKVHSEKNGDYSDGHKSYASKDTSIADDLGSDVPLPERSENQKKEKVDYQKKLLWDHENEKGRFSGPRGRGRGRGNDKSWGNFNRDSNRSESRCDYFSKEQDAGYEDDCKLGTVTSQESDNKKSARSQGLGVRRGRGTGSNPSNPSSDEKHQRAGPGNHSSARHYHQRDYRQQGGYDQQRAPRHQKQQQQQWEDCEGDGSNWEASDQFNDRGQHHRRDRGGAYRQSQDYYGQRNSNPQYGRSYRGHYYQEKYHRANNGYEDDSYSDRSFSKEKSSDNYSGKRQTGGFGRYSQGVAYSGDGSR